MRLGVLRRILEDIRKIAHSQLAYTWTPSTVRSEHKDDILEAQQTRE